MNDENNKIGTSLVAQILSVSVRRVNQLAIEGKLPFEILEGANGKFSRIFNTEVIENYLKNKDQRIKNKDSDNK